MQRIKNKTNFLDFNFQKSEIQDVFNYNVATMFEVGLGNWNNFFFVTRNILRIPSSTKITLIFVNASLD